MTTLYITEHAGQVRDAAGYLVQGTPVHPATAQQTVVIGATSTASNAFNASTTIVELVSDVVCSIAVGTAPIATATSRRLAANVPIQIGVPAGKNYKIAVITNS
jgi:hypothetical protein